MNLSNNSADSVKRFIVGVPRTCTSSVREACASVGLKVMHDPFRDYLMSAFKDGDFSLRQNNCCGVYDVFSDASICPWYKEFHKEFPDAKFLLTTRFEDDWLASMISVKQQPPFEVSSPALYIHAWLKYARVWHEELEHLRKCFREHNWSVREHFKSSDNFIEIDIPKTVEEEGDIAVWAKLAPFLGTTVNNRDFPHANRRRDS